LRFPPVNANIAPSGKHVQALIRAETGRRSGRKGALVKTWLSVLAAFIFITGCQAERTYLKPSLSEQGEVFVYLRPLPKESAPLKFSLTQVSAVREDGGEYPLALNFADIGRDVVTRQRSFASGELPPGNYVALSVGVAKATLQDEEGEEQLLIPEKPVRIECRFSVSRKKATFLSLTFRYDLSVKGGFSFSPSFSVTLPGKPVTGLVGYVSNYLDNTLTVFDKQADEVIGVIATGSGPRGMAFDQRRRRAYVALAGEDAVEVIDIVLGDSLARIRLKPGDNPQELALSADGKLLLTVNPGSNTVSMVDPLLYLETARIPVGDGPASLLIDPAGVRAYVFNTLSQNISVIDIASRTVVATASSAAGPSRGQMSRDGNVLYTIHELSSYLRLLNPSSLAVMQQFRVGMGLDAIKVDSLTNLIYTGRKYSPDIEVYEPSTFIPISVIKTPGGVNYLTMDGELNNLYAVIGDSKAVEVINLVTWEVVAEFDVGEGPYWVSLMGEGK
jgi:YVTN family beta-propeller protein